MAQTYKTLGQSAPSAATLTDVYTVPAATSAVLSTITICNRSATSTTYRVSIAVAGAADATKQYIAYDAAIAGNETHAWTVGIALATTDVVRVYATLATVTFGLFGMEST